MRDDLPKLHEIFLAQLAFPKPLQRFVPEEGEEHLFLQHRLGWRGDEDSAAESRVEKSAGMFQVRQVEQLEEAVDESKLDAIQKDRIIFEFEIIRRGDEPRCFGPSSLDLVHQPFHLRPVDGGFLRNHDGRRAVGRRKRFGECPGHRGRVSISLLEPSGESNAAGDRIKFGDLPATLGEQDVRPDDPGKIIFETWVASQPHQLRRLAGVKPLGDPTGLFALEAQPVKPVGDPAKPPQAGPQLFKLFVEPCIDGERLRRDPPLLVGE